MSCPGKVTWVTVDGVRMKRCTRCREVKLPSEYYVSKTRLEPESICKDCRCRMSREWQAKHPRVKRPRYNSKTALNGRIGEVDTANLWNGRRSA